MNALLKQKQRWELQNYQLLKNLVHQTPNAMITILVRAGQLTSFVLFLTYLAGKFGAAVFWAFIRGPRLVRQIEPYKYQERHEFEAAKYTHLPSTKF
jgi:hypothetical protein